MNARREGYPTSQVGELPRGRPTGPRSFPWAPTRTSMCAPTIVRVGTRDCSRFVLFHVINRVRQGVHRCPCSFAWTLRSAAWALAAVPELSCFMFEFNRESTGAHVRSRGPHDRSRGHPQAFAGSPRGRSRGSPRAFAWKPLGVRGNLRGIRVGAREHSHGSPRVPTGVRRDLRESRGRPGAF